MEKPQRYSDSLFKFSTASRQRKFKIEKKCFPNQTIGVSQESPTQFQQKYTFFDERGYNYKHNHKYATGTDQFHSFAQNKFFSLDRNIPQQQFLKTYRRNFEENPLIFHRKKGLLSQYMDKNGWMTKVHKLMGFQRDNQSRNLSNKQRKQKIKDFPKSPNNVKNQVSSVLSKPVNDRYFTLIPKTMGQQMKIRSKRNRFSEQITKQKVEHLQKIDKFKIDSFLRKELNNQLQSNRQHTADIFGKYTARNSLYWKTGYTNSTRIGSSQGKERQSQSNELDQEYDNKIQNHNQRCWKMEKLIK